MKNVKEMTTNTPKSLTQTHMLSIALLFVFAVFSVLLYVSNISFNNLMVYLVALIAYGGFSALFISSLNRKKMQIRKKLERNI
ncbi:hypothetical protein [Chryseobacterium camelliae]|uniref:hypothetical protein n=1 Tax=Chryseobacterium camelliae TaxID=1265445 RepID=UPI000C1CBAB4|nr:hypothetical protein [Chryseobacterium camelliae]